MTRTPATGQHHIRVTMPNAPPVTEHMHACMLDASMFAVKMCTCTVYTNFAKSSKNCQRITGSIYMILLCNFNLLTVLVLGEKIRCFQTLLAAAGKVIVSKK
jgi:hypothetical protein